MRFLLVLLSLATSLAAQLAEAPAALSQKAIESMVKSTSLTWNKKNGVFHFETKDNEVVFEIFVADALVSALPESEKQLFKKTQGGYQYQFHYPSGAVNSQEASKRPFAAVLAPARAFAAAHPFRLNALGKVVRLLKGKKVVFYTGDALSEAAGIPTMHELDDQLGFTQEKNFLQWVQRTVHNPRTLAQQLSQFHNRCFTATPTKAHQALSELARLKQTAIFTDNLDNLHQKTGFDVVHVTGDLTGLETLRKVDYVVCLGVSRDSKGFLATYKQINPKGRIVAIDSKVPNYLDGDDIFFGGDLQEIVPNLLTKLSGIER